MGNILELCAFELYPDPKISLGFTMCITRDYEHIPERTLIQDCALEHAIDFQALNDCASRDDGAHGVDLLRKSVIRTKEVSETISTSLYEASPRYPKPLTSRSRHALQPCSRH